MKVKKKYLFSISLIVIIGFFLLTVGILFVANKFGINYSDGKRYIQSGFSVSSAKNEEIKEYISNEQKLVDFLHYEINIELFPSKEVIVGKTVLTGIPKSEHVKNIILNFSDELTISKILYNRVGHEYIFTDDKIIIDLQKSIDDTFKVEIHYEGSPESLGFGSFSFQEHNEESVVYSLNEPIFASTWFPCNDYPSDKVLTDVYITNDSSMVSLSNGILISSLAEGSRKTYHWQTNYPIATYLISIYSANYEHFQDKYVSLDNDTMAIDYYVFEDHLENAKKDFSIHPIAIKHLAELFGEYPFVNEKYGVAEFMWSFGAMEHQTITGIGKNFVTGSQFFTGMLVHELAHQWWGNSVTLSSWKDIWLNEGFSTYSEALYWEKENGRSSLKSTMRSWNTNFNGTTLYNPEELFSRIIYNKGAWVLHMLRKEIGEESFFSLLKAYYEKYKYKNASTENFIDLAEQISDQDLSQFFLQWVFEGEGKIELNYSYVQSKRNEIELNILQVQKGYENYNFSLDLDFYVNHDKKVRKTINITERSTIQKFTFNDHITKIDLDPNSWLAAKIQFFDVSEN